MSYRERLRWQLHNVPELLDQHIDHHIALTDLLSRQAEEVVRLTAELRRAGKEVFPP